MKRKNQTHYKEEQSENTCGIAFHSLWVVSLIMIYHYFIEIELLQEINNIF